jgi:ABC-type glycerol-3-phosphate transport system substrate-binding protein
MQNGGKIVSTDRRNALFHIPETTPAGVSVRPGENALDFFTSFARPDHPNYTWNPSMPQALDAFGQGKVAMVVAFSDFGRNLKIKYPKFNFNTVAVPQISVAPLQDPVNLIRFNTEVVTKTADNSTLAFNFLKTYTDKSDANRIAKAYPSFKLISPFLDTLKNDQTNYFNKQVLTGKAVYKKNREQFDQDFRQMAIDVTQNGLTPDKALDAAAEKINVLLTQDEE